MNKEQINDRIARLCRSKERAEKNLNSAFQEVKRTVENYNPEFSDSLLMVLGNKISRVDEYRAMIASLDAQIELLEELLED